MNLAALTQKFVFLEGWRSHGPEWIEYDPETVTQVSAEEYNAEVERYRERVQETLQKLEE